MKKDCEHTNNQLEHLEVDAEEDVGFAKRFVRSSLKSIHKVGPGMKKIIKGLIGESEIEKQLGFMVEECCDGIILSFTKDVLLQAPKDKHTEREYFENMVRANPRLYNSCAALAPGSPLVEGIKPE